VLFSKLSAAYIDYQSKMILSDIDLTKSFFDKAPQIHWDNILTIGSQEINFGMDYMYRKETIGLDYQNEDSQWMANAHRWGAYGGTHWTVMTKLFTEIGFRINQLKAKNHSVVSFDPRLSMAYMLNQNHIIRFSTGLYHQFGDLFSHQDYDLKPKEAFHAALGYDYTSDQNHFRFSVYDKEYQNLFLNENDAVTNNGKGFARGFELYFLRNLNKMKWIVLYNFLNSKRREGDILELTTSKYQISHSVTLVFSYEFQSFSVGLRGSYAAGMPFTPLSDVMFDENSQSYIPMYGAPNSQQLPTFTRVDLNIKKNFSIGKRFFVAYLGVVNCFNRKNIQQYDFNSQTGQMDPFYSIFQRSFYMGFYVPFF
jgi:outer membrane cobalamin receptor